MLCEAYKVLDDDIWRVVGKVTEKVKGLLEGRFKKVKGLNSSLSSNNLQFNASTGRQSNLERSRGGANQLERSRGGASNLERSRGGTESKPLGRSLVPNNQAPSHSGTMKFQSNKQLQEGTGSNANLTKSFRAYQ